MWIFPMFKPPVGVESSQLREQFGHVLPKETSARLAFLCSVKYFLKISHITHLMYTRFVFIVYNYLQTRLNMTCAMIETHLTQLIYRER